MRRLLLLSCCIAILLTSCGLKESSNPSMAAKQTNGFTLHRDTEHFRIYYQEQDKECLDDLETGLEYAYSKVTTDLDNPLSYKVDIMVYPDIEQLKASINLTGKDDYTSAGTIGKCVSMVSPLNPGSVRTYEHMVESTPLHEFTHVVVNDIRASDTWPIEVPRWLNEGIASYEGGSTIPEVYSNQVILNCLLSDDVPTFKVLSSYEDDYRDANGYCFALAAGNYMVNTYGFEKIKKLIESPGEYKKIFGKTEDEIWKDWGTYLKANYS